MTELLNLGTVVTDVTSHLSLVTSIPLNEGSESAKMRIRVPFCLVDGGKSPSSKRLQRALVSRANSAKLS